MRITVTSGRIAVAILSLLALWVGGCASGPQPVAIQSKGLSFSVLMPLTGNHAPLGRSLKQGLELGLAEVNAGGGVNGQPVTLEMIDTKSNIVDGFEAVNDVVDHPKVVLLIGDPSLAVALGEQPAKYPSVIGYLCDYVAGPTQSRPKGLRMYLNGDQEASAIANYITASDVKKAAILFRNDFASRSNSQYMDYELQGGHLSTYADVYSADEHDYRLLGRVLQRVENEATVLVGEGPEYAEIWAALDAANWNGLGFGYARDGHLAQLAAKGRMAEKALYPVPDFVLNPRGADAGRTFCDVYRAKYGEDPDLPAAYAYDNIRALAVAATNAGTFDPQKIHDAFVAMKTYTGAAGRYQIKYDGDTEMPLKLVTASGQSAPPPTKSKQDFSTAPIPAGPSMFKDLPIAKPAHRPEDDNTSMP